MSNDEATGKERRDPRMEYLQAARDEMLAALTPKQREFFKLSKRVEFGSMFVFEQGDSKAWLTVHGENIHLEMIRTEEPKSAEEPKRGNRHASRLLKTLCELADKHGITLTLRAEPKDRVPGLNKKHLVDWYRRHGFKGRWDKMTRRPRQSHGV